MKEADSPLECEWCGNAATKRHESEPDGAAFDACDYCAEYLFFALEFKPIEKGER